jgi:hypothetical protein
MKTPVMLPHRSQRSSDPKSICLAYPFTTALEPEGGTQGTACGNELGQTGQEEEGDQEVQEEVRLSFVPGLLIQPLGPKRINCRPPGRSTQRPRQGFFPYSYAAPGSVATEPATRPRAGVIRDSEGLLLCGEPGVGEGRPGSNRTSRPGLEFLGDGATGASREDQGPPQRHSMGPLAPRKDRPVVDAYLAVLAFLELSGGLRTDADGPPRYAPGRLLGDVDRLSRSNHPAVGLGPRFGERRKDKAAGEHAIEVEKNLLRAGGPRKQCQETSTTVAAVAVASALLPQPGGFEGPLLRRVADGAGDLAVLDPDQRGPRGPGFPCV